MSREHILVVDDEEDIRLLLRFNLEREGHSVSAAATGEEALKLARQRVPDLVLLDLMLPGMSGLDAARAMKKDSSLERVPIIMLTAKDAEADVVAGLELGADDYVTKPFSVRVLLARIRAVLRRVSSDEPEDPAGVVTRAGISVHPGKREVTVDGSPVSLTSTEFLLLHLLIRRPGWVFTRSRIVDEVRGTDYPVTDRSVDVQVAGLRRKLGGRGDAIETVRGVGYRFREEA
ncbi:MAG: response regulator transcription factor [Deltaproteobacteria bacterium]|nr:response regulator transcription factor [Deltaproteobacteria bacterium]